MLFFRSIDRILPPLWLEFPDFRGRSLTLAMFWARLPFKRSEERVELIRDFRRIRNWRHPVRFCVCRLIHPPPGEVKEHWRQDKDDQKADEVAFPVVGPAGHFGELSWGTFPVVIAVAGYGVAGHAIA